MDYESEFPILEEYNKQRQAANSILNEFKLNHSEASPRYWPSMASVVSIKYGPNKQEIREVFGNCLRQNFYFIKNEQSTEALSFRATDSADLGSIIESILAQKLGDLQGYQRIFPDINGNKLKYRRNGISGEVDLVVRHLKTNKLIGIEVKSYDGFWAAKELAGVPTALQYYGSASAYIHKYIPINGKKTKIPNPDYNLTGSPKIKHLLQTILYLDEFTKSGIELFKIIYKPRDRGPDVEFDIKLWKCEETQEKYPMVNGVVYKHLPVSGIYKRFTELAEYVTANILPPKDYTPLYDNKQILANPANFKARQIKMAEDGMTIRDWNCQYCPFLSKCLTDDAKDITDLF